VPNDWTATGEWGVRKEHQRGCGATLFKGGTEGSILLVLTQSASLRRGVSFGETRTDGCLIGHWSTKSACRAPRRALPGSTTGTPACHDGHSCLSISVWWAPRPAKRRWAARC